MKETLFCRHSIAVPWGPVWPGKSVNGQQQKRCDLPNLPKDCLSSLKQSTLLRGLCDMQISNIRFIGKLRKEFLGKSRVRDGCNYLHNTKLISKPLNLCCRPLTSFVASTRRFNQRKGELTLRATLYFIGPTKLEGAVALNRYVLLYIIESKRENQGRSFIELFRLILIFRVCYFISSRAVLWARSYVYNPPAHSSALNSTPIAP